MFIHSLDPILLSIGGLEIRYYGIFYALGALLTYFWLKKAVKNKLLNLGEDDIDSLIVWLILGVVIGARLGEVLLYKPAYYLENPIEIPMIWHGGLSFHGGLIGLLFVLWLFCKKKNIKLLQLTDNLAIPLAVALGFGRIANFINGELYGTVTSLPWGVKFPGAEGFRHPSQLYEALKNFFIAGVLAIFYVKGRKTGFITALFFIMYGVLRFIVEFVREPEVMVGMFTLGQLLSIPLVIAGVYLILKLRN